MSRKAKEKEPDGYEVINFLTLGQNLVIYFT